MSQKQPMVYNKWLAIILDIFGILFVLVGATLARARPEQLLGFIIYWLGLALLILALLLFGLDLFKKPDVQPKDLQKPVDKDF